MPRIAPVVEKRLAVLLIDDQKPHPPITAERLSAIFGMAVHVISDRVLTENYVKHAKVILCIGRRGPIGNEWMMVKRQGAVVIEFPEMTESDPNPWWDGKRLNFISEIVKDAIADGEDLEIRVRNGRLIVESMIPF